MIKGNKGEWSELYVLVSLLAEGKLYQADVNLNKDINNVYDVIKAYKLETDYALEFSRDKKVTLNKIIDQERIAVTTFSIEQLKETATLLYDGILSGKGKSFAIMEVNDFMSNASIQKLKADSSVKADIRLKIYDHRIAKETDLGFSIKSLLGGNSTLFNTGAGNNFIYTSSDKLNESISSFNKRTYKSPIPKESKITYRLNELENAEVNLQFKKIQSHQLWKNLKMVDGDLPEILSWALYFRWIEKNNSIKKIAEILEIKDPLNYYNGEVSKQKLYEYKLKKFLAESAMGMTSETPWLGEYDSFGGVIIAKEDGDILCFHIYDFNLFRNYLINNTVFEQASTGEDGEIPGNSRETGKTYYYSWLYEDDNELAIKLNLQVRFK